MKREQVGVTVAVVLGLLAASVNVYVQQASTKVVPVVVAAHDLEARRIIRAEDVVTRMVGPAGRDGKAVQDATKLVGRVLMSPVYAGEQIRETRVSLSEREIGAGEVAIGIPVDLSEAVGGRIETGDLVDLYLVPRVSAGQNVAVYALGAAFRVIEVRDATAKQTGRPEKGSENSTTVSGTGIPAVVVVKMPSEYVIPIRQARALGTITMAQRSPYSEVPERPVLLPLPGEILKVDVQANTHPAQDPAKPAGSPVPGGVRP